MDSNKKKATEKRYMEAFSDSRPDLQLASVQDQDHEKPDFLFQRGSRQLGIEVTYFSTEPSRGERPPEEQDSLRKRVVQIAQDRYKAAGGLPVEAQVIFRSGCQLSKARAPKLGKALAALALPGIEFGEPWQQRRVAFEQADPQFPEIEELSIFRVPTHEHGGWIDSQGGWAGHATKEDIARIVATKESKIPVYKEKCEEIWLLIVFRPVADATYLRHPEEPLPFRISTSFDRVFCMEPCGPISLEVPVERISRNEELQQTRQVV